VADVNGLLIIGLIVLFFVVVGLVVAWSDIRRYIHMRNM